MVYLIGAMLATLVQSFCQTYNPILLGRALDTVAAGVLTPDTDVESLHGRVLSIIALYVLIKVLKATAVFIKTYLCKSIGTGCSAKRKTVLFLLIPDLKCLCLPRHNFESSPADRRRPLRSLARPPWSRRSAGITEPP